jgi:hypothetical protein
MGNYNPYGTRKGAINNGEIPAGMPAAPHGENDGKAPRAGLPEVVTIPARPVKLPADYTTKRTTHQHMTARRAARCWDAWEREWAG